MIELKEKPICCGKEMDYTPSGQRLIDMGETQEWVCLICGHFITLTEGSLDEEELQELQDES